MGSMASEFTTSEMYPATATGWSGMVIPATAGVPTAPSGIDSAPFPRIALMIPPPNVLCRRISRGKAGSKAGSLDNVSCDPIAIANVETSIPTNGPAIEISNMACLFLGSSLNVVMELVIPVTIDGTNVGTDNLT